MKTWGVVLSMLLAVGSVPAFGAAGRSFDFTNESSNALVQKAWASLDADDLEAVEAYVAKTNEIYSAKAKAMQAGLKDFASGSNQEIFKYWALNDVSTAWFILGKAYRNAGKKDLAIIAFNRVINDFSYGQCWNKKIGIFWKPAQAAKEEIALIQSGSNLDFGDYTSSTLVQKAWASLSAKDLAAVEAYVKKADEFYSGKAREMQAGLRDYPSGNDQISKYWALNDVGTAWFVLGEAYQNAGKNQQAVQAYKKVISQYSFAQSWDAQGFYWSPTDAAQQRILEIGIK